MMSNEDMVDILAITLKIYAPEQGILIHKKTDQVQFDESVHYQS